MCSCGVNITHLPSSLLSACFPKAALYQTTNKQKQSNAQRRRTAPHSRTAIAHSLAPLYCTHHRNKGSSAPELRGFCGASLLPGRESTPTASERADFGACEVVARAADVLQPKCGGEVAQAKRMRILFYIFITYNYMEVQDSCLL